MMRTPVQRGVWLVLALVAGILAALPARGGIDLRLPSSRVEFDLSKLPARLSSGDFSLLTWVWIDAPDSADPRPIITIPETLELRVNADSKLSLSLSRLVDPLAVDLPTKQERLTPRTPILEGDEPPKPVYTPGLVSNTAPANAKLQRLSVTTSGPIRTNAWTLVCIRFERSKGKLSIWARSDGGPARAAAALDATWINLPFDTRRPLVLGSRGGNSCISQLGIIAIRSEQVPAADLDAIFGSRRLLGVYDTDRRSLGSVISGPPGVEWMIGHSMPTFPQNGAGGGTFDRSAVVGRLVGLYNVTVYQATYLVNAAWNRTGAVAAVKDAFFASPDDGKYAGFFKRDGWKSGVGPAWVPGASAPAQALVDRNPSTTIRVMTSSNSRGVKNGDGSGFSPGNYAHGFIEKYRDLTSGILMRPAILTSGGNPWFGFDCATMNPQQSAPGTIIEISGTTDNAGDFGRFFTGSAAFGRGPGAGVFLLPSATYGMRCRPENLSLLSATAPLDVEAYVLRYPGATRLKWRGDRGANQAFPGIASAWNTLETDTTRVVLTPESAVAQSNLLVSFFGDQTSTIFPGDICAVASGPGARSISMVKTVTFDGTRTRITFEMPLKEAPSGASAIHFGDFQIVPVKVSFPALAPGDTNSWRGIAFQAESGGAGVPIFAFSAVRPDVPGFVFGTSGWGGHGYQQQLDFSFPAANRAWMALTGADLWIQVPAEQLSTPPVMDAFTDLIRSALPSVSIVWAGESGLQADANINWHQYILSHAAAKGVIALSVLEHPRVGNLYEQYADGLLSDGDHYSQRGNRRLADLWIAQLRMALRACPADYDKNGTIDSSDMALFETDLASQNPSADYNADGLVDQQDLTAFLAAYASGC